VLIGDILEVVGCAFAAVATFLLLAVLASPTIALAGAFFVIAAFLAYSAQGYATVQFRPSAERPLLARLLRRNRISVEVDGVNVNNTDWIPDSSTFEEFMAAVATHTKNIAVTRVTASNWLASLRRAGVVAVEGNLIVKAKV
jgi:hypothetical protein